MTDAKWLAHAIELATANVAAGGGPFGAVIVRDGKLLAEGQNRVTRDLDPTAHAEIVAMRAACTSIGDFTLAGATIYTSCEPCPMCVSTALWARLDRVVYAADRQDANRAGFDDLKFYELLALDRADWPMPLQWVETAAANAPFEAWLANPGRTDY